MHSSRRWTLIAGYHARAGARAAPPATPVPYALMARGLAVARVLAESTCTTSYYTRLHLQRFSQQRTALPAGSASESERVPAMPSIRRARAVHGPRRRAACVDRLGEFLFALLRTSRQIRSVGISDFTTEIQSNIEKNKEGAHFRTEVRLAQEICIDRVGAQHNHSST